MIGGAAGTANRPQQLSSRAERYPAPYKGIDARIALAEGSPNHCIYSFNLIPSEYGMKVRKGYREYQTDVTSGNSFGVRTVIPFDAVEQDGLSDKLFAVTNEGIFNVTVQGDSPSQVLAFANPNLTEAGFGNYVHFTGEDEKDVMFYADSLNGLFEYDAIADTWAQAAGIVGPVVEDIRFICTHKNRIWLVERDKNYAWYLDLNARQGPATKFYFGSKFENGGAVAGLFSWSIDGGAGNDDYLVAVSRAGDVLVYQGNNPDDVDDWTLRGSYYIGEVPIGPSFGSVHGGDLYLLSIYGLNSLGELLQGVDSAAMFNSSETTSPSAKVAELIKSAVSRTSSQYGWAIRRIPSESGLLIAGPEEPGRPQLQYFYKLTTAAWAVWRDVPLMGFDTWQGSVVFGTADNRVCLMNVNVDNFKLNPPPLPELNGDPIVFAVLTSYRGLNAPAQYKRVKLIRADFVSQAAPDVATQARYDYDLNENVFPVDPAAVGNDTGLWDISLWDSALWAAGFGQNYAPIRGSWGTGRYVAISMRGETRQETFFIGWDIIYDVGGPLL